MAATKSAHLYSIKYFHENVAASDTDEVLIAAVPGKKLRVLSMAVQCGASATDATFESDGSADTEIHKVPAGANGGQVLNFNEGGWFETLSGEALVVTTGAGASTSITGSYIEAP